MVYVIRRRIKEICVIQFRVAPSNCYDNFGIKTFYPVRQFYHQLFLSYIAGYTYNIRGKMLKLAFKRSQFMPPVINICLVSAIFQYRIEIFQFKGLMVHKIGIRKNSNGFRFNKQYPHLSSPPIDLDLYSNTFCHKPVKNKPGIFLEN